MKSMTGFGYYEFQDDKVQCIIDLKSYNNRYLDIQTYQPYFLNPLEPKMRKYLSSKIHRGRVELSVSYTELNEDLDIQIDDNAANGYYNFLNKLKSNLGINDSIHLSHLLRFEDSYLNLFW